MKNLFNYFIVGTGIVSCLSACTENQSMLADENLDGYHEKQLLLSNEEMISISYDNPSEYPQEGVFAMVSAFLELELNGAQTKAAPDLQFVVRNKEYLREKNAGMALPKTRAKIPIPYPSMRF